MSLQKKSLEETTLPQPQASDLAVAIAENTERAQHLRRRLGELARILVGMPIEDENDNPEPAADGFIRESAQIVRRSTAYLSEAHDIMTYLEYELTEHRQDDGEAVASVEPL